MFLLDAQVREYAFQNMILDRKAEWTEKGYVSWNKTAGELVKIFIEGKRTNLQAWGAGAILLIWILLDSIITGESGWVLAGVAVYIFVNLAVQRASVLKGSKQALKILGQGETKTILGFFTVYYGMTSGKMFGLLPEVQEYAAAALCDQEAYSDALDLLGTIRRKPRMEAYFQQYAWICFQDMGDRQGCRETLERMEASMRFLKGKNLEAMQKQADLFRSYVEGRYDEVIRAAQDESRNVLQKRTRQRLAESALREMRHEQQIIEKEEACDGPKQ